MNRQRMRGVYVVEFAIIGLLLNIFMLATGGMQQYMEMMQQMQQVQ